MEHVGIDVHKAQSQVCIVAESGELIEQRIRTERGRFAAVLGPRPRARILIEASTESEWVARCLEELGHEVVVADPNFAPMYATRSKRVKTDRRDARALAEACWLGAYRPAHRTSDEQRHVRAQLAVRDTLVRTRARCIHVMRALLRRDGLRVRSGAAASFAERVKELRSSRALHQEIAPLLGLMGALNRRIAAADAQLAALAERDTVVRRLCSAPGIGPVTAVSFVATIDRVERFRRAHEVESYLGLTPRESSSGEKQHKGRITKAGSGRTRWLLVEAAWAILLHGERPETAALKAWAERIALRRGKRVAAVALARRLAGLLFALWRDESEFHAARVRAPGNRTAAVA
jgi:transposase